MTTDCRRSGVQPRSFAGESPCFGFRPPRRPSPRTRSEGRSGMRSSRKFHPAVLVPIEERVVPSSFGHATTAGHTVSAPTPPSTSILNSFPREAAALAGGHPVYEALDDNVLRRTDPDRRRDVCPRQPDRRRSRTTSRCPERREQRPTWIITPRPAAASFFRTRSPNQTARQRPKAEWIARTAPQARL